jgi:hypothetical protein
MTILILIFNFIILEGRMEGSGGWKDESRTEEENRNDCIGG